MAKKVKEDKKNPQTEKAFRSKYDHLPKKTIDELWAIDKKITAKQKRLNEIIKLEIDQKREKRNATRRAHYEKNKERIQAQVRANRAKRKSK